MKCNHCGQEFGDGINCQHCGCDRVEGLGSFNGYYPSQKSGNVKGQESPLIVNPGGGAGQMLCFHCGEVIPSDSEYCPYCQESQYVHCPKCGYRYFARYPSCNKCGTNRVQYISQKEEEKREQELRKIREEQQKQELCNQGREREIAWLDNYLKNNKLSLVDEVNEEIRSNTRKHSLYVFGLLFFIIGCIVSIDFLPALFSGTDDQIIELVGLVVCLPICVIFIIVLAKLDTRLDRSGPKDLLISKIHRIYSFNYIDESVFLLLISRNGIVCSPKKLLI